jgi:hypothetical protein
MGIAEASAKRATMAMTMKERISEATTKNEVRTVGNW